MKKITLLIFLLLTLQLTFVQASQESKMLYEAESIIPFDQHVDKMVIALPSMVQTFTFLQEQGLVDQSFCQFIQTTPKHFVYSEEVIILCNELAMISVSMRSEVGSIIREVKVEQNYSK